MTRRSQQKQNLASNWVKDNQHWIAICALIVGALAWVQPQLKSRSDSISDLQLSSKIQAALVPLTAKLDGTDQKIARLEGELQTLIPLVTPLIQKKTEESSHLAAPALKSDLPMLAHATSAARATGYPIAPDVVDRIRSTVSQIDSSAPSFWPVSSDILSLSRPIIDNNSNKKCDLNKGLVDFPNPSSFPYGRAIPVVAMVLADCTFELDDVRDLESSAIYAKALGFVVEGRGVALKLALYNVRVIYRGGRLPRISFIDFERCAFDFRIDKQPSADGVDLTKNLLAAKELTGVWVEVNSPYRG